MMADLGLLVRALLSLFCYACPVRALDVHEHLLLCRFLTTLSRTRADPFKGPANSRSVLPRSRRRQILQENT